MVSDAADVLKPYCQSSMNISNYIIDVDNAIIALYGENTSDARKRAILSTYIGDEGKKVISNLSAAQKDTYVHLQQALIEHYKESPLEAQIQLHETRT